jgi:[ribosomal protein S5]-alanine N-acetyltransferase
MEKMPFNEATMAARITMAMNHSIVSTDWQRGLPVLSGGTVTLRELQLSDAPALLAMLTTEEVARFISPPPTTVDGFERFIVWANAERQAGRYACFGVVPAGMDRAIGIFQVRQLEPGFATAEWGFAIGSPFWATGLFQASAELILEFSFDTLKVHRLEARAAVRNGRGNGALRKIGATCEGVLRRSFLRNGEYIDQNLWSVLASDWREARENVYVTIN